MANGVFNIAKGRVNELTERIEQGDPAAARFQIRLLKTAEADATLQDYDTFQALLVPAGNVEADFTNYVTKTLTSTELSRTVDDTANTQYSTSTDVTYTAAGGASNNTLVKLVVCYDPAGTDVDANLVPLTHHDFSATTDGNDLIADFGTSFYTAS